MSGFGDEDASHFDHVNQQPVNEIESSAAQPHDLQAEPAAREGAAAAAVSDPAVILRDCTASVACAFLRRNASFLREVYERLTDDSGWLPAANLAQAMTDVHAPLIPDSEASARATIALYDPDSDGGHMKFAHFCVAVNEPDHLQLWFQGTDFPAFADALRPIVGRGSDQMQRVADMTPEHLDIAMSAISAASLQHLLNVQLEVRRALAGPFESAMLR